MCLLTCALILNQTDTLDLPKRFKISRDNKKPMASTTFSHKSINPSPPDKGSFPLDHENECKIPMIAYFKCLSSNNFLNEPCREASKEYLECRMEKGLMAREDWEVLGYKDLELQQQKQKQQDTQI